MRNRIAIFTLFGLLTGCGSGPPRELPPASPGLELQEEGYTAARSGFRTRLIRRGPSPQPGPMPATPGGTETVEYISGGLRLTAFVTPEPGGVARRPAVLFLHGGFAFGAGDWEMTRPFRDAGYAVMVPVLRGENGQPGDFTMFFDEVDDVLAAADVLANRRDVDPARIYVSGHSAGGTLALLAALASGRFRAATSASGDPDQYAHTVNRADLVVFDRADPREFRLRSPVAFANDFRCPVRLYYGDEEAVWAENPSVRTAMLAQRAGLDVEAVEVPGGHTSSVPRALRESIAFFRKNE